MNMNLTPYITGLEETYMQCLVGIIILIIIIYAMSGRYHNINYYNICNVW